jgi:hypothetical protein
MKCNHCLQSIFKIPNKKQVVKFLDKIIYTYKKDYFSSVSQLLGFLKQSFEQSPHISTNLESALSFFSSLESLHHLEHAIISWWFWVSWGLCN